MTYADVLARIRAQLNDSGDLPRWPDAVLLRYAGTVMRRMAEVAPHACSDVREMVLAPGALQTLPSWAVRFLGGVRRAVDNKSVRNVSPEVMDNVMPGWRDDPASLYTTDCVYDQTVPNEFGVYPPVPPDPPLVPDPEDQTVYGPVSLYIRVSVNIDDPADRDETIPLNKVNEVALIHGILGLAFSQDTDAGDIQLGAQHWGLFYETLGVQRAVDQENPPAAKEDQG